MQQQQQQQNKEQPQRKLSPVVLASVPLQVLLFYNVFFWIAFVAALVPGLALRLGATSTTAAASVTDIFVVAAAAVFALCEPLRIYLGYSGNLLESVPSAAAFALLTVFPQLPLWAFLLAIFVRSSPKPFPLGVAACIPVPVFLVPEFVLVVLSIRRLVRAQQESFFQFGANEDDEEDAPERPSSMPSQAWVPLEPSAS